MINPEKALKYGRLWGAATEDLEGDFEWRAVESEIFVKRPFLNCFSKISPGLRDTGFFNGYGQRSCLLSMVEAQH